jgi:hypothetical protein
MLKFSEINEIIKFLVEKENDETLIKAYQASYAALNNISFNDFKRKVNEKIGAAKAPAQSVEAIHKKVENIINNNSWTEV